MQWQAVSRRKAKDKAFLTTNFNIRRKKNY